MKEERLKKMHEKRNEKKMIKNSDSSTKSPEIDQNSAQEESPIKERILNKEESNPNENMRSSEKSLKIVNGKLQIAYPEVSAIENDKIITLGHSKPEKTTSMSFRQRNHTEKWTPDETKKFFRVIKTLT